MSYKVAITTGDSNGIGLEVTCKALQKIVPNRNVKYLVYLQNHSQRQYYSYLKARKDVECLLDGSSPALWVERVLRQQLNGEVHGLVTGPLSKTEIRRSGLADLGHTDIIKRVTSTRSAYMAFLGRKFNVALATGHIPLKKVSSAVSAHEISKLCVLIQELIENNFPKKMNLPIGLLGLNPHAGDSGLIGDDELQLASLVKRISKRGLKVAGPLVPDACFIESEWKKYCFYIALYHDQGLIPFKMAHERSGAHLTLGAPIVRTSVDHGTAFDIFGMDKADPSSMFDSIQLCLRLIKSKKVFK